MSIHNQYTTARVAGGHISGRVLPAGPGAAPTPAQAVRLAAINARVSPGAYAHPHRQHGQGGVLLVSAAQAQAQAPVVLLQQPRPQQVVLG